MQQSGDFLGEIVADNHEQQNLQSAYSWYYYKKGPTITFLLSLGLTMNSPSLCHYVNSLSDMYIHIVHLRDNFYLIWHGGGESNGYHLV